MADSDRQEHCPECSGSANKVYTPLSCHGLSDGPGTRMPNKPHKPIFDKVDVHNDSLYTYNKLRESGRLDRNPAMRRDMETHLADLANTPREIVDYQITGHDLEK